MLANHDAIRSKYQILKRGHYLSSASITGIHDDVAKAHHEWIDFSTEYGSIEDHKYFDILQETRKNIAEFYGSSLSETAFVCNSSYAFNIMAMLLKQKTNKRKVIIAEAEFPTSYLPWVYQGFEIITVRPAEGKLSIKSYTDLIDEDTAAVVCSAIFSFSGQKMPIEQLGKELRELNVEFFVNSTQAAGVFPLHWETDNITGLCFSCHKRFAACMGTTVFILKEDFFKDLKWPLMGWTSVEDPWDMKNIGTTPRMELNAVELGSMPFANINAINASIIIQKDLGISNIQTHILDLTEVLVKELKSRDIELLEDYETRESLSGIVSFKSSKVSSETLINELTQRKIFLNQRQDFVRASIYLYNNEADIYALIDAIDQILKD